MHIAETQSVSLQSQTCMVPRSARCEFVALPQLVRCLMVCPQHLRGATITDAGGEDECHEG